MTAGLEQLTRGSTEARMVIHDDDAHGHETEPDHLTARDPYRGCVIIALAGGSSRRLRLPSAEAHPVDQASTPPPGDVHERDLDAPARLAGLDETELAED